MKCSLCGHVPEFKKEVRGLVFCQWRHTNGIACCSEIAQNLSAIEHTPALRYSFLELVEKVATKQLCEHGNQFCCQIETFKPSEPIYTD